MIHEAKVDIVVEAGAGFNIMGIGAEPPIPHDDELQQVFPDWVAKGRLFIARCLEQEGKTGMDVLTQQDLFRYGMKFIIVEGKKLADVV